MTLREVIRQFKKHYKAAMKLKEGGKAWEREISAANAWKEICTKKYNEEWAAKYGG